MEVKVIYVIVVKEEDRSVFHIHYLSHIQGKFDRSKYFQVVISLQAVVRTYRAMTRCT